MPFDLETPPQQATFYISSLASIVYGIRMLRKSYYMEKYSKATDSLKKLQYSAIPRLSLAEKEYAKFLVSSFQLRGLGFVAAPPLIFMSCEMIQFWKNCDIDSTERS